MTRPIPPKLITWNGTQYTPGEFRELLPFIERGRKMARKDARWNKMIVPMGDTKPPKK